MGQTTRFMQKYEYKIMPVDFDPQSSESLDQDERVLNMFGKDGWELVAVMPKVEIAKIPRFLYFLKRPIS